MVDLCKSQVARGGGGGGGPNYSLTGHNFFSFILTVMQGCHLNILHSRHGGGGGGDG